MARIWHQHPRRAAQAAHHSCLASVYIFICLSLYLVSVADALDCGALHGCVACTSMRPPHPVLPAGYKLTPPAVLHQVRRQAAPDISTMYKVESNQRVAGSDNSGAVGTLGNAVSALRAAGSSLASRARDLAQGVSGAATPVQTKPSAEVWESGIPQQAVFAAAAAAPAALPQLLPSPGMMLPSAAAPLPLVFDSAADGSSATMEQMFQLPAPGPQVLSILRDDPRDATGPHPWDVLLFKTNQFNTTRPAYHLGGLGLMLMKDFNDSQPLTDWQVMGGVGAGAAYGSEPAAAAAATGGAASSSGSSSGGGGGSMGGPVSSLLRQALERLRASAGGGPRRRLAAVAASATAEESPAPVTTWCTACLGPAYQLTPFGHCGTQSRQSWRLLRLHPLAG
jgi:hypothetical protein